MKQVFTYLLFILVVSCNAQDNSKSNPLEKDFKIFINNFEGIKLPFKITKVEDYIRREVFDYSTSEHRKNIFKSIEPFYYKFLFDENVKDSSIDFRYIYKLLENSEYIGILYIKDYLSSEGIANPSWLILNIYNRKGEIIDKLTIAGEDFDLIYQFCEINQDYKIKTTTYHYLPEDKKANVENMKRVEKEYFINDKGKIINSYSRDSLGVFNIF